MRLNESEGCWQTYDEMDPWDQLMFRAYEGWKTGERRRHKKIGYDGRVKYVWEYFVKYSSHNKNPQGTLNFSD